MAFPSLEFSCPRARCFNRNDQVIYENNGFRVTSINCCSCFCFPLFRKNAHNDHVRTRSNLEEILKSIFEEAALEAVKKQWSDPDDPLTVGEMECLIKDAADIFKRRQQNSLSRFYNLFETSKPFTTIHWESLRASYQYDFSKVLVHTVDDRWTCFDETLIRKKIEKTSFNKPVEEHYICCIIDIIKDEIAYGQLQHVESKEIEKWIAFLLKGSGYQMQKPHFLDQQQMEIHQKIDMLDQKKLGLITEIIKRVIQT